MIVQTNGMGMQYRKQVPGSAFTREQARARTSASIRPMKEWSWKHIQRETISNAEPRLIPCDLPIDYRTRAAAATTECLRP